MKYTPEHPMSENKLWTSVMLQYLGKLSISKKVLITSAGENTKQYNAFCCTSILFATYSSGFGGIFPILLLLLLVKDTKCHDRDSNPPLWFFIRTQVRCTNHSIKHRTILLKAVHLRVILERGTQNENRLGAQVQVVPGSDTHTNKKTKLTPWTCMTSSLIRKRECSRDHFEMVVLPFHSIFVEIVCKPDILTCFDYSLPLPFHKIYEVHTPGVPYVPSQ